MEQNRFKEIKDQIIDEACTMCLHDCFPQHTNQPLLKSGMPQAYRVPDDGQPFGFRFKDMVDIEVHVEMVARTISGTKVHQMVPQLAIYGIAADGKGVLIANKILPTTRSF